MLKAVKTVINIMAIICYVLIGVYVFVAAPQLLGYRPVVVLTGSMEPECPVGSVLYYKAAEFDEINVGDIITFNFGESSLATHRVVEKSAMSGTFVTKGDANEQNDNEAVPYAEVQGKVVDYKLPLVGYYINFVGANLYLIAIPIVILLAKIVLSYMGNEAQEEQINGNEKQEETNYTEV